MISKWNKLIQPLGLSLLLGIGFGGNVAISQILPTDPVRVLAAPFDVNTKFIPCGWMGDGEGGTTHLQLNPEFSDSSRPGDTDNRVIKISYQPGGKKWAGIYWLYPNCNWGTSAGTQITGNPTKVVFWAKSESPLRVKFIAGGVRSLLYKDSFEVSTEASTQSEFVPLNNQWQSFELDISNVSLEQVIGAFAWVIEAPSAPGGVVFYLDGIRYE